MPPPGAAHPQVSAATAAWIDAFNACDAVRLAAMYAPTAMLWGTTAQTLISSPAGVRQYFDRACAMNPPPKAILVDQSVHVHGEFAVSAGRYTFVVSPGGQPRQLPARFSFTWRWVDGRWAIVEHHSSPLPPEPAPARPAGGS